MLKKYILSYGTYLQKKIISGRSYTEWENNQYSLKKVPIENNLLARELEKACDEAGGILTYGEYQQVDQFGKYGYHATHGNHGIQPINQKNVTNIVTFCIKNKIQHIVDYGCGSGNLGISIIKEAQKKNYTLFWSGIEINTDLHDNIRKKFRKARLENFIVNITSTLTPAPRNMNSLLLFSFSLDSIPPEIFTNINTTISFPNSLIGVTVKNQIVSEIILSKNMLREKKLSLSGGIFTDSDGIRYDLRTWKLAPKQRAYIPIASLHTLIHTITAYNASHVIIIDEFRFPFSKNRTTYLGVPYDLHTFTRTCTDILWLYKKSGDNLYFYPLYLNGIESVLKTVGFRDIHEDIDPLLKDLYEGKIMNNDKKINVCGTILAQRKQKIKIIEKPIVVPGHLQI